MQLNELTQAQAHTIAVEVATLAMESVRKQLAGLLAAEFAKAGIPDAWSVSVAATRCASKNYALGNAADDIVSAINAGIQYAAIAVLNA